MKRCVFHIRSSSQKTLHSTNEMNVYYMCHYLLESLQKVRIWCTFQCASRRYPMLFMTRLIDALPSRPHLAHVERRNLSFDAPSSERAHPFGIPPFNTSRCFICTCLDSHPRAHGKPFGHKISYLDLRNWSASSKLQKSGWISLSGFSSLFRSSRVCCITSFHTQSFYASPMISCFLTLPPPLPTSRIGGMIARASPQRWLLGDLI
jgi:hypothetical protein